MQEHHLGLAEGVGPFLHGDIAVLYSVEFIRQLGQLEIMSGEQDLRPALGLVQVLHHRPGYGDAVEGGGAAPYLVEEYKALRGGQPQYRGGLPHFHHKSRFAAGHAVLRAYARHYAVRDADLGGPRRDEGTHLRHYHGHGRLAQIDALAAHIGAGEYYHARPRISYFQVVRHECAGRQKALYGGMAAFLHFEQIPGIHARPGEFIAHGAFGQGVEHVQFGRARGEGLYLAQRGAHLPAQLAEKIRFQLRHFFFGAQYLVLQDLQLLGDIALGVNQRLLAHEIMRHLGGLRLGDLDVIAENSVIAHLQGRDPGLFLLALLNVRQQLLAVAPHGAQLFQLRARAFAHHAAVRKPRGGILR